MSNKPEYIYIKELQKNDKIPAKMIKYHVKDNKKLGIEKLKCVIRVNFSYDNNTNFDVVGDHSGENTEQLVVLAMIYNGNNQLIGMKSDAKISAGFTGRDTFTIEYLEAPIDETISYIDIRVIKDPAIW